MRYRSGLALADILVCSALLGSGCGRGGSSPSLVPPVVPSDFVAIDASRRVYYNDAPGLTDSLRLVIKDPSEWANRWRQITSNQPTPPPLPQVDFSREMLLLAGAGRMSPGDQIKIDSVGVRGKTVAVVVRIIVECRPFPGESYPLEIVRIGKSADPVTWVERRVRAGC